MPSHTFRWDHPAQEVFVTGTFDNWRKSERLDKSASGFEKTVSLSLPGKEEKILYKFVADGDWKHDHTAKTETDHEGNVNNVLYPADLHASNTPAAASTNTTAMAAHSSPTPGAFPETPAPNDEQRFSVDPLPATTGTSNPISLQPGEQLPPSKDITSSTIGSNVKLDEQSYNKSDANHAPADNQTLSVNPLPATGGIGNPVSLAPGEKVPEPSSFTSNTVGSNVKLDEDSYNKSDASAPFLPPALSPDSEKEAFGNKAIFGGLGPQTTDMIPESSMGMGGDAPASIADKDLGPHISSVGPSSTTAQLAGSQPLENQRSPPEIVTESQQAANVDPEASASPRALQEKDEVESELASKVPEAPPTAESTSDTKSNNGMFGMAAGGLAAAGTAAAGYAYSARDKTTTATGKDPVSYLPQSVQDSINSMNTKGATAPPVASSAIPQHAAVNESEIPQQTHVGDGVEARGGDLERGVADTVPEEVLHSQKEAHFDPEAAASPVAVEEKSAVERELLGKVPESTAMGESAPAIGGSGGSTAMGGSSGLALGAGAAGLGAAGLGAAGMAGQGMGSTSGVPEEVLESQKEANVAPEAAAVPDAVQEKSAMEDELLNKVPESTATGESAPTPAPASTTGGSGLSAAGMGAMSLGAAGIGAAGLGAAGMASHGHGAASGVPEAVTESQREAHVGPEAAAVPEAVQEKSAVEDELLSKIPTSTATGAPAPEAASAAAFTSTAPAAASVMSPGGAPQLSDPTAGVAALSMDDKPSVPTGGPSTSTGLNAPASEPALPPTQQLPTTTTTTAAAAPAGTLSPPAPAEEEVVRSRDVSPMTKTPTKASTATDSQPMVTTGVDSAKTPATQQAGKPIGTPRPNVVGGGGGGGSSATPQKRQSFIDKMRGGGGGTPESQKSTGGSGGAGEGGKKRGLFKRIADKLKAAWRCVAGLFGGASSSSSSSSSLFAGEGAAAGPMRRILEMSGGLGAVGDGLGDGVEGAGCGGRDGGGVEGFGSGGSGGWGIAGLEYGLQREEEGEDRVHREKEEGGDVDKEQEGEVDVDKAAEGEEEAVAQFSDDNTQVAGTDDDEHADDDNDHVSPRESHREKEKEKEEKDDSIPLDLGPSIPRDNDDDSLPTSSRTLLVDERDGPGGGRGSRADDERSVASSGLREMGRRGRRYAFGAACVEDLESEGEGVDGGAAVGGSGEGADAGPPSDGAGGGGSARVMLKWVVDRMMDRMMDPAMVPMLDRVLEEVLELVLDQLQNLDYTSSSGSSGAAASVHREIPTRTHNLGLSRFGVNARAATEGGPRRPFRGLRHRPGIADFSGPLENLAARSQSIDLDDSIPTPDTGILAEVNGSPSDENLENLEPLSLQRTGSSKYRPKSKGKESVHDDPEEVHDETVATASAEPTGPISPQREQRQPVGHQPESSRDALANAAAEPTSPQSQPSPLPRTTHIRGGPRDNGARDPGHWSLDPRHDSTTNTAAEEATRMTIEWLQNSDAEGSSPVDRHGAPKQDWEVRLRNPLP